MTDEMRGQLSNEGDNISSRWESSPSNASAESVNADSLEQDQSEQASSRDTQMGTVTLFGIPIICLYIEEKERLCLAQISNTLLRDFSYNEIHNRRVALGITCLQCTPVQLEILRRTGAMPVSSRRCGLITKREAERLVRSFLEEIPPPKLPENFSFSVYHKCGWGCQGIFIPSRYNSSRAKCIKCAYCHTFFSPNKFIFHYHKNPASTYRHPDAANFNSWRRHLNLMDTEPADALLFAWEDVKSMFNGGCRKKTPGTSHTKPCSPTLQGTSLKVEPIYPAPINPFTRYPYAQSSAPKTPERTHPAFQLTQSRSAFGSYGEMLRSLSMHYNPWWKPWYLPGGQMLSTDNPALMLPYPQDGQNITDIDMDKSGLNSDSRDEKSNRLLQLSNSLLSNMKNVEENKSLQATDCFNIASLIGETGSRRGESQTKTDAANRNAEDALDISIKNYSFQDLRRTKSTENDNTLDYSNQKDVNKPCDVTTDIDTVN